MGFGEDDVENILADEWRGDDIHVCFLIKASCAQSSSSVTHKPLKQGRVRKKKGESSRLWLVFIGSKCLRYRSGSLLLEEARRVGEPDKFGCDQVGQSRMISQFGHAGLHGINLGVMRS